MQQNQDDRQVQDNHSGQQSNGRQSIQFGQQQGTNRGYKPAPADDDDDDVSEIPDEHHNKEGQPDYRNTIGEQRQRDADEHEHPYSGDSSPRGGQQTPTSGQGSSTSSHKITY